MSRPIEQSHLPGVPCNQMEHHLRALISINSSSDASYVQEAGFYGHTCEVKNVEENLSI